MNQKLSGLGVCFVCFSERLQCLKSWHWMPGFLKSRFQSMKKLSDFVPATVKTMENLQSNLKLDYFSSEEPLGSDRFV